MNIYPFYPLCRTPVPVSAFQVRFAYQSKDTPFVGEACETNHSQVRTKSCWEKHSPNSSVTLLAAIMQVSTWFLCAWGRRVGVRRAMPLIGDARQATSEGKSSQVETGLTGPAGTALYLYTCMYVRVDMYQHCSF